MNQANDGNKRPSQAYVAMKKRSGGISLDNNYPLNCAIAEVMRDEVWTDFLGILLNHDVLNDPYTPRLKKKLLELYKKQQGEQ